jgi:hypothetical protein
MSVILWCRLSGRSAGTVAQAARARVLGCGEQSAELHPPLVLHSGDSRGKLSHLLSGPRMVNEADSGRRTPLDAGQALPTRCISQITGWLRTVPFFSLISAQFASSFSRINTPIVPV